MWEDDWYLFAMELAHGTSAAVTVAILYMLRFNRSWATKFKLSKAVSGDVAPTFYIMLRLPLILVRTSCLPPPERSVSIEYSKELWSAVCGR